MSYKNNIKILEKYFNYLSKHPEITALSGQHIIDRIKSKAKISYKVTKANKNFLIDVVNGNKHTVKKVTFRIFWDSSVVINAISAEIIGTRVSYVDNPMDRFTDVTLYNVKPSSSLKLIATYNVGK
jgi:predicted MPP superfamily phosphohydrolase